MVSIQCKGQKGQKMSECSTQTANISFLNSEVKASKEIANIQKEYVKALKSNTINNTTFYASVKENLNDLERKNNYKYSLDKIRLFKNNVNYKSFQSFKKHIYVGEILDLTNTLFKHAISFNAYTDISKQVNLTNNTKLKFTFIEQLLNEWIVINSIKEKIQEKINTKKSNKKVKSYFTKISLFVENNSKKYFVLDTSEKKEILSKSTKATDYLNKITNNVNSLELIELTQNLTSELSGIRFSNYRKMTANIPNNTFQLLYK